MLLLWVILLQFLPLIVVASTDLVDGEFIVTATGGTVFTEDIDLSDGDWADYDAENDAPVSLSNIEFKWEAV